MPSGPRPRGRWAVSRRGELDNQPNGLDPIGILSMSSKHSLILNPMAAETVRETLKEI